MQVNINPSTIKFCLNKLILFSLIFTMYFLIIMQHHFSQTLDGHLIPHFFVLMPEISAQNYAVTYVILGAAS